MEGRLIEYQWAQVQMYFTIQSLCGLGVNIYSYAKKDFASENYTVPVLSNITSVEKYKKVIFIAQYIGYRVRYLLIIQILVCVV